MSGNKLVIRILPTGAWSGFSRASRRPRRLPGQVRCSTPAILFAVTMAASMLFASAYENDLTSEVAAGKMECFFQEVKPENYIEVEYQVVDGGDLDINFSLQDPHGTMLVAEMRKSEGVHRHDVAQSSQAGIYKFCFDNTFSRISPKLVFFEVIAERQDGSDNDDDLKNLKFNEFSQQEDYDVQMDDISDALVKIRSRLVAAIHFQESKRAHEMRDRNIVESNFSRVNNWSLIQIVVMLFVSTLQVYTIRSLFDEKNKLRKLIKAHT